MRPTMALPAPRAKSVSLALPARLIERTSFAAGDNKLGGCRVPQRAGESSACATRAARVA
jgi:hypothetical protein